MTAFIPSVDLVVAHDNTTMPMLKVDGDHDNQHLRQRTTHGRDKMVAERFAIEVHSGRSGNPLLLFGGVIRQSNIAQRSTVPPERETAVQHSPAKHHSTGSALLRLPYSRCQTSVLY